MSDYGKGYALCLVQFLFHEQRLNDDLAEYATSTHPEYRDPGWAVLMWLEGAKDHVYDLTKPRRLPLAQWREADAWAQDLFAHGLSKPPESWARTAVATAKRLLASAAERAGVLVPTTVRDAIALDAALGAVAEEGTEASCQAPLPSIHALSAR